MIQRKQGNESMTASQLILERSRLIHERTLAERNSDHKALARVNAELKKLEGSESRGPTEETNEDRVAKINERNRKSNLEAIRRVEQLEQEKRRQRKLAASSGSGTPKGKGTISSLLPGTPTTRPGTPLVDLPKTLDDMVVSNEKDAMDTNVDTVEIDLGDF
ncbi:hypothetical protein DL96DRAFT_1578206 [Flagelloscypha sp. PMI_526]|nr:hypothetical protein DL96DRAFT_1578206 [Flagelloscypha sp. PMI_526]